MNFAPFPSSDSSEISAFRRLRICLVIRRPSPVEISLPVGVEECFPNLTKTLSTSSFLKPGPSSAMETMILSAMISMLMSIQMVLPNGENLMALPMMLLSAW